MASVPRNANPRAPIPCSSSQARTQFPQRIHLFGSLTRDGELRSSSLCSLVFWKRTFSTPRRCASSCRTHSPLFTQVVQSRQCAARSSSTMSFLYFLIRPELVWITMPSLGSSEQDANIFPLSSSTVHRRQAPNVESSEW